MDMPLFVTLWVLRWKRRIREALDPINQDVGCTMYCRYNGHLVTVSPIMDRHIPNRVACWAPSRCELWGLGVTDELSSLDCYPTHIEEPDMRVISAIRRWYQRFRDPVCQDPRQSMWGTYKGCEVRLVPVIDAHNRSMTRVVE